MDAKLGVRSSRSSGRCRRRCRSVICVTSRKLGATMARQCPKSSSIGFTGSSAKASPRITCCHTTASCSARISICLGRTGSKNCRAFRMRRRCAAAARSASSASSRRMRNSSIRKNTDTARCGGGWAWRWATGSGWGKRQSIWTAPGAPSTGNTRPTASSTQRRGRRSASCRGFQKGRRMLCVA